MSEPLLLRELSQMPASFRVDVHDGLSAVIDSVAETAPVRQRFLRFGWFAAALQTYGGNARTIIVSRDHQPIIAMPIVTVGPKMLRLAMVPGCYWPYRSFPAWSGAGQIGFAALLETLAGQVTALRLGPVYDNDPTLELMRKAAAERGWTAISRHIAESFLLDMAALRRESTWPRNSTLRKNRFHEKHLSAHGVPDWSFVEGRGWTDQMFADLAAVETRSWITQRTAGEDAKFTDGGHSAFWRAAASDPTLAEMMVATVLRIDGRPVAFSFDINSGPMKYAIANSYDPEFSKHSPGKLVYYRNLLRALDDGMTHVDWGAGDVGYKRVIGAEQGPAIRDWLFVRPGLAGVAAKLFHGWWAKSGQPEG